MNYTGGSPLDRWAAACISVLIGVVALYLAVRLIEAMWVALLVIGLIGGAVGGTVAYLRWRRQVW